MEHGASDLACVHWWNCPGVGMVVMVIPQLAGMVDCRLQPSCGDAYGSLWRPSLTRDSEGT